MVSAFESPLPYAHHAIQIVDSDDTRPTVAELDAIDALFADQFGFALRYEVTEQERTAQYQYGYLLPKGKELTPTTLATLEDNLAADTHLESPTVTILSIDPKQEDLDGMVFVGTPPSEALQEAMGRLKTLLDELDSLDE